MVIVTIDGPAGAGKSTVARRVAEKLGYAFLDTGAMYRALVYAAMQDGVDLQDASRIADYCRQAPLEFLLDGIRWKGELLRDQIRSPEVSRNVRFVADHPQVRSLLVEKQRELARQGNIVCEGRDQGTVVFPNAEHKFFLVASTTERAQRRLKELQQKGIEITLEEIQREQEERDHRDRSRPVGPLAKADDAVEIKTDGMSIDEVVEVILESIRSRSSRKKPQPFGSGENSDEVDHE